LGSSVLCGIKVSEDSRAKEVSGENEIYDIKTIADAEEKV
jgi:hypothetical protein